MDTNHVVDMLFDLQVVLNRQYYLFLEAVDKTEYGSDEHKAALNTLKQIKKSMEVVKEQIISLPKDYLKYDITKLDPYFGNGGNIK